MGIISASLPTLRPILTMIFRKVGLTQNGSKGANTPGKSIVTFGRGNVRNKNGGYSMAESITNDQDSMEHISGWPEEHHGRRTATVGVGHGSVELNHVGATSPQSINVKTELAWKEFHVREVRDREDSS